MKKLYFILLLISGILQAQTINIPDPIFKAKLLSANASNLVANNGTQYVTIDTNSDGQIQVAEALLIKKLRVDVGNISSLDGIQYFTALNNLQCQSNSLTALNISALTQLTDLNVSNNQLTSLDLSGLSQLKIFFGANNQLATLNINGCTALTNIDAQSNHLTNVDFSTAPNLYFINLGDSALQSLNLAGHAALGSIQCDSNQITSINVSGCPLLNAVSLYHNQLTAADFSGLAALQTLAIGYNPLTSLNVAGCSALSSLNANQTLLPSLGISNMASLYFLYCNQSQLTSLTVANCPNLHGIQCGHNALSNVTISNCNLLSTLDIPFNNLTTLNTSMCPALVNLMIDVNPIITLFIKNGQNENLSISGVTTLQYICADESQITQIQQQLASSFLTNVVVNSYCSFSPGGNYNTISGNISFDANNNGCDAADPKFPLIKIKINDGTNQGAAFTDALGNYKFYTSAGNFTITPDPENIAYFNSSPSNAIVSFANSSNNTAIKNFCLAANGIHNDLEVAVAPLSVARPGFNALYTITYKNNGNQVMSGNLSFNFSDAVLNFVAASPNPATQGTGVLNWNFSGLYPFESRSVNVTLYVNSSTEVPPVNVGDVLSYSAAINPVANDETPEDNTHGIFQTVVGAIDPNDKICLEGNVALPIQIGDFLHYNINFENTGTAAAENVVVKDMIDMAKFDSTTLQVMNASHPVTTRIAGNKVEFIFENINLGASQHGNIIFKIKTKSTVVVGDVVTNKADIFFDYNFPVTTNTASTVFQALGVSQNTFDNAISVYPNPTTGTVNLKSNSSIKSVYVFDIQGRVVATYIINETDAVLDMSTFASGIYYLKMTTDKGIRVEKLIKK